MKKLFGFINRILIFIVVIIMIAVAVILIYALTNKDEMGKSRDTDNNKKNPIETTGTWEEVADEYITAMIHDHDRKKASSLTDPSHYYIDNGLSEKYRMHFVEDLIRFQEDVISSVETMEGYVKSGKWDYYTIDYTITTIDDYESNNEQWVDIYFTLDIIYSAAGIEDEGGEYYRLSLKKYPHGWKVTWLAES